MNDSEQKIAAIDECLTLIGKLRATYPDDNLHYAERLHLTRADHELRELRARIVERGR